MADSILIRAADEFDTRASNFEALAVEHRGIAASIRKLAGVPPSPRAVAGGPSPERTPETPTPLAPRPKRVKAPTVSASTETTSYRTDRRNSVLAAVRALAPCKLSQIAAAVPGSSTALKRCLRELVADGEVVTVGVRAATRYLMPGDSSTPVGQDRPSETLVASTILKALQSGASHSQVELERALRKAGLAVVSRQVGDILTQLTEEGKAERVFGVTPHRWRLSTGRRS